MFDKEQTPEELNKIMGTIIKKQDVLSKDNEETNNVQLEEDIYQQMNLIKQEDIDVTLSKEIKWKLDKKYGKIIFGIEINEIGQELNINEIETNLVNNVVPKSEESGEPSRRNIHFMRPRYVPANIQPTFLLSSFQRKPHLLMKSALPQLAKHDIY